MSVTTRLLERIYIGRRFRNDTERLEKLFELLYEDDGSQFDETQGRGGMSSLTDIEKRYLEKLLGMQSGYVLDYSDATFWRIFQSSQD